MKKIFYLIFLTIILLLSQSGAEPPSFTVPVPPGGVGDVTAGANITDNAIVRGDGGAKGVQGSTATIDDSGNLTVEGKQTIDVTNTQALLVRKNAAGGNVLIVDTTNRRVGINGTASEAFDLWSDTLLMGAQAGVVTRGNNTVKNARILVPHYTNATEENVQIFAVSLGTDGGTISSVQFGGGSVNFNAATSVEFYTAADATTVKGTKRLQIDKNGNILAFGAITGTNAEMIFAMKNGTAPTTSPADIIQMWSADNAVGDARLNIMSELSTRKIIIGDGNVVEDSGTVSCASDVCAYTAGQQTHYITSAESDATPDVMTVTDGTITNQNACFELITTTGTDDVEITPSNFANGTKITLDTAGESVCINFNGANWTIRYTYGGVIS